VTCSPSIDCPANRWTQSIVGAIMRAMSRPLDPLGSILFHLLSPKGYPHTRVRLPEHYVSDLPTLLAGAQAINPGVDADALIRKIWRLGCRALLRNNERRVPVPISELPLPKKVENPESSSE
jgi:hypothetical protein